MTSDDLAFLKQAFQATADEPLEAGDPRYVDLAAVRGHEDPAALMARTIELSAGESVQLFSGFPGTGKTTELKRLQQQLVAQGYRVGFVDLEEHLSAVMPIDVRDVLFVLLGPFEDVLAAAENDEGTMARPGFWEGLGALASQEPAVIKETFRNDAGYRDRLRSMIGPGRAFDVHAHFAERLARLRAHTENASEVVLIVDSVEHIRGSSENARTVQQSVEAVFTDQVDALRIAGVHVVCTVPPYVRGRATKAGRHREGEPIYMLPAVAPRNPDGTVLGPGVGALKAVVARRIDCARLVADDAQLERIIAVSGGNLRDLLRLLREIVRRAESLPVPWRTIDDAIAQLRAEFSPISPEDVAQLARAALTHQIVVDAPGSLALWTDNHLLLSYRNGGLWYDVHPIIQETVAQQARDLAQRPLTFAPHEPDAQPASAKQPRPLAQQATPVALTADMRVTLVVENYRALHQVRWTLPRGVSALVGPNGSGKTTLLDVPALLRHALTHDARKAVDDRGGPGTLRSAQADRGAPVILGVELDHLTWQLDLSPKGAAFNPLYGERATLSGAVALDRSIHDVRADDPRPLLRRFVEQPDGAAFRPLVALLEGYRLYGGYDLAGIRVNGSQVSSDEHLHPDGRNIFSVLRNWRDRKETRPRWEFVLASLKAGFPDTFDDLDFDMAGQTVSGRMVAPQPDVRIPTYFAANGWFVALLHLAAVASTGPAGVVAIDEMENGLHPYAIRALIDAMRGWAEQTGISIVLATHSPVVIDQFKEVPDHIFVMEPGREPAPTRLDELHDPEWLAHFSLGDLYAHDEFGAQHKDGDQVA